MRQAREIHSSEVFSQPQADPRDRAAPRPRTFDGSSRTLVRLESAGLCWPLPEGIGDAELEAALYANTRSKR